jgi:sugar lactone lactonase YvrE
MKPDNAIDWSRFRVNLDDVEFVGRGLQRPECVLCNSTGDLYVSDAAGGVQMRSGAGVQRVLGKAVVPAIKANGISLCRDGSFLIADIAQGGVYRLGPDGKTSVFLHEVDGVALPPTNFATRDAKDRTWITVSTRLKPRTRAYRPGGGDGFIILVDQRGARIVADNIGYTNEVAIDQSGNWLYVNETCGKRVTRFRITADGRLDERQTVAEFGAGTFPDGLALDTAGGVWITSIISNRVIRVDRDGSQQLVLEDCDADYVAHFESLFAQGKVARHDVESIKSRRLRNISSIAFGGKDLKTIYLGCLLGDAIATFPSPIAGQAPAHWEYCAAG